MTYMAFSLEAVCRGCSTPTHHRIVEDMAKLNEAIPVCIGCWAKAHLYVEQLEQARETIRRRLQKELRETQERLAQRRAELARAEKLYHIALGLTILGLIGLIASIIIRLLS